MKNDMVQLHSQNYNFRANRQGFMTDQQLNFFEIFPWNNNFKTGIPVIDEQHRKLVVLLNQLAAHIANQSDHIEVNDVFNELAAYADHHFKTEEGIWRSHMSDHPRYTVHLKVHASFVEKIMAMKNSSSSSEDTLEEILKFLVHWLAYHILDDDKRMAKIAHALDDGLDLDASITRADLEMSGAMRELIEAVLTMYDSLSSRTLELMKERSAKQKALKQLKATEESKAALVSMISAMSKAVEARDPYTSGHQDRVAEISVAIAGKMGLNEEQIEGIWLGAKIHDIGKLKIPTEILVKPTRLSLLEYTLIKEHPASAGEILEGIKFPWPVTKIAMQHHERLDGSGYPNALKGDEICIEAKVVAVADVFEAMSSHRPYRAALGIETAIKELIDHKGTLYDAEAVDALVAHIRENPGHKTDTPDRK